MKQDIRMEVIEKTAVVSVQHAFTGIYKFKRRY